MREEGGRKRLKTIKVYKIGNKKEMKRFEEKKERRKLKKGK